jgi:AcrR family transcriptional regulator
MSPTRGARAEEWGSAERRVPGRRGQETRDRLLASTAALLARTSWRDIKIIDIAKEAGTSPATFYQYFESIEQAIFELAERLASDASQLAGLVEGSWKGEQGWATARAVIEGFMDYWERNRYIFRVVDLATEEGDNRFRGLRTRALNAVTVALTSAIEQAQAGRKAASGADAAATAGVLVAMMANVAAHRYGFEFWGMRTASLVDSQARILYWSVTGRQPPKEPSVGSGQSSARTKTIQRTKPA